MWRENMTAEQNAEFDSNLDAEEDEARPRFEDRRAQMLAMGGDVD